MHVRKYVRLSVVLDLCAGCKILVVLSLCR